MAEHAAPIPLSKRLLTFGALATSILLVGLGVTQVTTAEAASTALSCDQNTLYAINNQGAVESIAASSGTATPITQSFSPANNALAISQNGTFAYATVNATAANPNGTLTRYDPSNNTTTAITGVTVPATTYRGAVDPSTGIYYYAQGNTKTAAVYAYDPAGGGRAIGQVGYLDFAQASTGDFAFSTTGVLYAVSGNQVVRVNGKLPTTAGTTEFTTTEIAALGSVTTSPGIAFSTNGYLYVAVNGTIVQINPSSGATVGTPRTIADGSGNTFTPTDLASCNYADSISAKTSVNERWRSTDQFSLAITGNGLSYGNTATTSGTATGTQAATAGSNLVVPTSPYTVTQSAANGTNLSDYSTTWSCDTTTGRNLGSGTGQVATVNLPTDSDNDVSCLFTNTLISKHVTAADDSYSTPTDRQLTVASPGVKGNDAGTGITITGHTDPANGTLTGFDSTTGAFTYTPNSGFAGEDTFTYTEQDSSGQTVSPTVTIYVGPTAVADTGTVATGGTVTATAADGVLANDRGSKLTASNASSPAHGTVDLRADGSYTYTSTDSFSGQDTWTYDVTDAGRNTSTGTVTMTITPRAVADTLAPTTAGTATTSPASSAVGNDVGTTLTLDGVSPTSTQGGTVTTNDDKTSFTYVPADGFSGTDTFGYTVKDATGGIGAGTETIVVTPVAKDDTLPAIAHGAVTTIDVSDLLRNDLGSNLRVTGVDRPTNGQATLSDDGSTVTFTPDDGFSGSAGFTYQVTDGVSSTAATATIPVKPAPGTHQTTATSGEMDVVAAKDGLLVGAKGTDLSVSDPTTPQHGTVTVTSDGGYTYTPDAAYSGPDAFSYTVTDGSGDTSTGTVTITVLPKAHDDSLRATDAGAPVTVASSALLGNDNGLSLSIASVGDVAGGHAALNQDGTVTFTPAAGFSGPASFTYTATDGTNPSTATVSLSVKPVAAADILPSTPVTESETVPAAVLLANDKGSGLSIVSVGSPSVGGVLLNTTDGSITYTPQPGFSGIFSFDYTVQDATNQQDTATASIRVTPDAGTLSTTATAGLADSVDSAHGLLSNATGSGLQATLDTAPGHTAAHGAVTLGSGGAFVYTPTAGFSGRDSFDYVVTDASGGTGIGTVSVTVLPKALADTVQVQAGGTAKVTAAALLANDRGTGLEVTSVTAPAHGDLASNSDGSYSYTPVDGFSGSDSFGYTVTDAAGSTSSATVTVTVAVTAVADSGSTTAGRALTVAASGGVLANDTGTRLKATVAAPPRHGVLTLASDGSYSYTPDAGYSGPDSFTYTATDTSGQTATATVKLAILPSAPNGTARGLAGSVTHIDAPGVLGRSVGTGLAVTAVAGSSAPGTPVTLSDGNTVTIAADGTFDFAAAAGFSGPETITYTVTDASGQTATGQVTVTVAPRALDDAFTTPSRTALPITAAQLTGNDLGVGLTVTAVTPAASGSGSVSTLAHGTLARQSDGSFVYTPTARFSGTDSFAYTITDSFHGTSTATATILVGDLAADYTDTVLSGTPRSVSADDGLLSNASGTGLVPRIDRTVQHGSLLVRPDGSYTYTPADGFSGTDTFTYTVTDHAGQISTGLVTLTVAPTATDDAATVAAGSELTLKSPGVLGNDSGSALLVTAVGTPTAGGTVAITGHGTLDYTPKPGFSGVETVPYTITDQDGQTAHATVTITVRPRAVADAGQTVAGHALRVTATRGLLANDQGTTLRAALQTAPKHGTVTVRPDGSYVYTPTAGFSGRDTFTYSITDAAGTTTTAVATIDVLAAAEAASDTASGEPGRRVSISPLRNDTASAGANLDPSTVQLLDPATGAPTDSFTVPGKGTFAVKSGVVTFTPKGRFIGTASIGYQVSDSDDVLVASTITVTYPKAPAAGTGTTGGTSGGSSGGSSGSGGSGGSAGGGPASGGSAMATPTPAAPVSVAGTIAGSLAFTGSQGVSGIVLIGFGILMMGLALVLFRRFRRPEPGPRRTGA
ncbi:Ig-like domain-containing protein [Frondihabitans peucedani]|uniref:CshA-type fibril repeat protein n=1 Tax=Frondihabitans peucedani TaxID=598626 RepID=A0ABP8E1L6_9MICO